MPPRAAPSPLAQPRFLAAGDSALVVEFGSRIDRALSARVTALDAAVRAAGLAGVVETIATFRSLMLQYDPLVTSAAALRAALGGIIAAQEEGNAAPPRHWRVPVCFAPEHAPDLAMVAEMTGQSPDAVVAGLTGLAFHVYMVGGFPGYPHMGDLPPTLRVARLKEPRLRVPPGSVAMAGQLAAIYPLPTPGGWNLVGRTPVAAFDPAREPPALFAPGDTIRLEAIGAERFAALAAAVAAGGFALAPEA